jgi:predicted DNA-binding protein
MSKTLTLRLDDEQEKTLLKLMSAVNQKTSAKSIDYAIENYFILNEENSKLKEQNSKLILRLKHLDQVMLRSRNVATLFLESVSQDELF